MSSKQPVNSFRKRALDFIFCFAFVTVETLHKGVFGDLTVKAAERTIANLRRDDLLVSYPFIGNRKLYGPSRKAARQRGLDERRYSRPPGPQVIVDRFTVLLFAQKTGMRYLTAKEFSEHFPEQAGCSGGLGQSHYFIETTEKQPKLVLLIPAYGTNLRHICRKARRELANRRQHQAFRDLIFHDLFRVVIATGLPAHKQRIAAALDAEPFRYGVVAMPELNDLLL
jgi:hypothetical protein